MIGGKLTNQVKCYRFQQHLFRAFLEKWRHMLCIITSSANSQYLKTEGVDSPANVSIFVLYHIMLSGNFYGSEIRHGICFWHITHSSSTLSFQGHVISSTTPSQQNLPEKQIFWVTDPLGAPGCVYFLVIRWFILTDFYTMSLHINTYFVSNFSWYRSPSCRVALHAQLFHTVDVRYQKSK